jgi:hypothetical protein
MDRMSFGSRFHARRYAYEPQPLTQKCEAAAPEGGRS